ncbi:MAG: uroporphyrinogen decarboxylase [Frondihabitans sp.]|nr:uroporphyrinogen decarboxylase [Frondihabitans sp.]
MSRYTPRFIRPRVVAAAVAVGALALTGLAVPSFGSAAHAAAGSSSAASGKVTNLAHLDFLLDSVPLPTGVPGHSTYDQASSPTAEAPWVYANHEDDGSYQRVGGGNITDAAKGWYAQGAFDADDIARSAVVYLRDWKQNGTASSEQHAFQLLRELTYLQTSTGPNAGDVVLWQQSDGTLNPSAIPVDNPNPSDSGNSYWLARTVWALGEGYSEFKSSDPAFASFLQERMDLSITALDRQTLATFGSTVESNGVAVPTWLITGSAGASAEAVLGLAAYVKADPRDTAARTALTESADGIAAMSSGKVGQWPFGAIIPETDAQTYWHAWSGLAPAALSEAAAVLHRPDLSQVAVTATAQFTAQLLASGGPDNGLSPTPSDTSQIAYGADSLVESLLTTADDTGNTGLDALAATAAGWYFGANPAGVPVYSAATGDGVDGISATGEPNLNFGAESTIHTELSMLALDAHPSVRTLAESFTSTTAVDGQKVVEAESGVLTGSATVVTPASASIGAATWSGGKYVQAASGSTITVTVPAFAGPVQVYPVVNRGTSPAGTTRWTSSSGAVTTALGSTPNGGVGAQGIATTATELKPLSLSHEAPAGTTTITARVSGTAQIDALLLQPVISHLGLSGPAGAYGLYVNGATHAASETVTVPSSATVSSYDSSGRLIGHVTVHGSATRIRVAAGGFTTVAP